MASQFWEHVMYIRRSCSLRFMLASNTSKNLALMAGCTHRSPARKAGSSFTVSSEHLSVSSLQVERKTMSHDSKQLTTITACRMKVSISCCSFSQTLWIPLESRSDNHAPHSLFTGTAFKSQMQWAWNLHSFRSPKLSLTFTEIMAYIVFWIVTLSSLVGKYLRFRRKYCLKE
jgi:hypothetical protein